MATSANHQSFLTNGKNPQMIQSHMDRIIECINYSYCNWASWHTSEIEQLCLACSDIFLKEPSLLELKAPIKIAGNLYGQFNTLLSIFEHGGVPPQSSYLFLGNYGDRAGYHLETVALLLALKIKYPENIFLLRGSDDYAQSRILVDEVDFDEDAPFIESVNYCFSCLPLAAIINDKIHCTHGYLSPYLNDLDQIRQIKRPYRDVSESGLLRHLARSLARSRRPYMAKEMYQNRLTHGLRLICCGHKVWNGYEVFRGQEFVTICSASRTESLPAYHGQRRKLLGDPGSVTNHGFPEVGAMMSIDAKLMYSFRHLEPKYEKGKVTLIVHALRGSTTIKCGEDLPPEKPSETSPSDSKVSNSKSSTDTSKCDSSSGDNSNKLLTKYTSVFAGFKLAEWMSKSNSESTTKSESSPPGPEMNRSKIKPEDKTIQVCPQSSRTSTPAKYRSNYGSGIGVTDQSDQSKPRTNPAMINFDRTNPYRSKSPGVKRFLGARV